MGRHSFSTVIVGPRTMLREGLARILSAADFCVAASASSVEEIAPAMLPRDQPILLVIDVCGEPGAAVREIEFIRERYPTARIALLADHDQLSDGNIVEAFRAGAHAYFAKPTSEKFIKSLELVMLGETILPPQLMAFMLDHHNGPGASNLVKNAEVLQEAEGKYTPRLSAREKCILGCLIAGDSNKIIARNNAISEATVKVHVKAILRKIRVNNRTQAAIWAMHHDRVVGGMSSRSGPAAATAREPISHRSVVLTRPETPEFGPAHLSGFSQQRERVNGEDKPVGPAPTFNPAKSI